MRGNRSATQPRSGVLLAVLATLLITSGSATAAQDRQALPRAEAAFSQLDEAGGLKATGAFPFDYQHLAFRGARPDSVQLWAAASVHAGRVRGVFDGGWKYALGIRFDVFRDDSLVASDSRRVEHLLNREVPHETADGFPLQAAVQLVPGVYTYRMEIVDYNWSEGRSTNVKTGDLTVPPFAADGPVVSSIAIAADSGGTWQPGPAVALKLNAARIVRRESRPYVYFEVYGLTPGGDYRGEVKLRSTWVSRGRADRFTGTYQPFQMQYRGSVPASRDAPLRTTLRLDMERTEPGPYEITVRVLDLTTGVSSPVRRARLKVQETNPRRPSVDITEVAAPAATRDSS